jgi:hypothetical protein
MQQSFFPASTHPRRIYDVAHNFTGDIDWDDFFEINGIYKKPPYLTRSQAKKTAKTMAYQLMIAIILICKSGDSFLNDEIVKEFIDEAINYQEYQGGNVPLIGILQQQVVNIKYLYEILRSWKTAYEEEIFNNFTIYRGFKQYRYERLFNLPLCESGHTLKNIEPGESIIIPTFLSTSINFNTALRFTAGNNYLWEIMVPRDKLKIFKYVYFGDSIKLNEDDSLKSESEILLNIGTKLKYMGATRNTYTYLSPSMTGTPEVRSAECIHQMFVFVGYEEPTDLDYLDQCLSQFDDYTIEQKRKKRRRNRSSSSSMRRSSKLTKKKRRSRSSRQS